MLRLFVSERGGDNALLTTLRNWSLGKIWKIDDYVEENEVREAQFVIINGCDPSTLPPVRQLVRALAKENVCLIAKEGRGNPSGLCLGAALCHPLSIMNPSAFAFSSLVGFPFNLLSYPSIRPVTDVSRS